MADDVRTIPERTTQKYSFTLKDESGAVIPGTSLDTATLSLFKSKKYYPGLSSTVTINSRELVDVKANVNGSGVLTFTFVPLDNVILDDSLTFELHMALFEWTYNGASGRGQWQLVLNVANAEKVPA